MLKKSLRVVLAVALLLFLVSCGSSSPNGRYDLFSAEWEGITVSAEQLEAAGGKMYIVFYDNGSGELGFGVDDESQTERFTWKDSQITDEEGETLEFGFDGSSVTLSKDGAVLVFKSE